MSPLFDDPLHPFGAVRETTMRVVTWNVWCHFGPWPQRFEQVQAELVEHAPDVIALQEVWKSDGHNVVGDLADALGFHVAEALEWYEPMALVSGCAVLSRWPVLHNEFVRAVPTERNPGALIQWTQIDGPRGAFDVFTLMLDWRLDLSETRQRQVCELAAYVKENSSTDRLAVICGDFNAAPDSEEIRMLNGRSNAAAPGLMLLDAWDVAGDGSAGHTWSNANPWAAIALLPDRRIDYLFSAWPRPEGIGHAVNCELIGRGTNNSIPPSDHYGVMADLRY
jgi:endonuclease/exonuclease/phosphatase family metal-dependent hydrolase